MHTFVLVVHIILAVLMILLILVQQGKGAEAGASFGGGGAATVFGASGSANFLTRMTAILTALFFVTSMTLAVFAKQQTADAYSLGAATPATTQAQTKTATSAPVNSTETSSTTPKSAN
ncbi:preprotein translocase subunit SecG [Acinetobacter sp. MD2(2019)]|uniref:preprotein translocase subunit SecG n=1 Tax=Acinetobacter sp. MD2(2019) TaxID=2605273 RepID=UPI002D1F3ABD|nr:preprotein translocase subunit SecG [Acinetobacter sp. MD2(2019)]MEB3754310.1 preprotein translocase subunit SecG [Acinetobacter sp. MD2(2019)]